jgi:hypothetical protein
VCGRVFRSSCHWRDVFGAPTIKEIADMLEARILAKASSEKIDQLLAQLEGIDEKKALELLGSNEQVSANKAEGGLMGRSWKLSERLKNLSPAKRALLMKALREEAAAESVEDPGIPRRPQDVLLPYLLPNNVSGSSTSFNRAAASTTCRWRSGLRAGWISPRSSAARMKSSRGTSRFGPRSG